MTSREQIYVFETIKAMKKKIARDAIESDSDSEIQAPTNRGNKLKQKARFVREGKLGPPTGPAVYKEEIEHAGYRRSIISRNPPLVDADGYDIDSDDDDERIQDAVASAAEDDPYASIHLEQLLAPLTAVTDLPNHPSLSRAFTSNALTDLSNQACELLHKESTALAKVRPLLTKLSGDHTWANCEMFLGPNDREYFDDGYMVRKLKRRKIDARQEEEPALVNGSNMDHSVVNGEPSRAMNGESNSAQEQKTNDEDVTMTDASVPEIEPTGEDAQRGAQNSDTVAPRQPHSEDDADKAAPSINGEQPDKGIDGVNGESQHENQDQSKEKGKEPEIRQDQDKADVEMADGDDGGGERDTSKQKDDEPAAHDKAELDETFIHPIFLAPKSAHPDRDLGLPEQEAEDVRRLLQLYVQKQEEVCRGAKKLHEGLLKSDSLRKKVLAWSKAEAHCGDNRDMSDGEDWYDKEEWGLTEDLKKGQDEEEEDTTQTQKKTRNRNK